MKTIFKKPTYLVMIIATLLALISFITFFFVKNRIYFTIMFSLNIIINFFVSGFILLINDHELATTRFKNISIYLFITFFLLYLDVIVISSFWDLNIYSNLMYVTNIKLYLGIYAIYVLAMILISIYVSMKEKITK
jgi:hypothetical protein